MKQHTIKHSITINGIALHSGKQVNMELKPAYENSGITFYRTDLNPKFKIPALYNNVGETKFRNTTIGQLNSAHVQTIEHLMAALYISDIDNIDIFVDNPETPIKDGCALSFIDALQKAEIQEQNAPRKFLRILKKITVNENDSYVSLEPSETLKIKAQLVYPISIIGDQSFESEITFENFKNEIAMCRTFGRVEEYEYLKANGMARGANETNVIAIDNNKVINPEPYGLRYSDEFVRHKIIDAVGDLYTSGYHILGKMTSFKGSHALNNKILYELFSNKENYEIIE